MSKINSPKTPIKFLRLCYQKSLRNYKANLSLKLFVGLINSKISLKNYFLTFFTNIIRSLKMNNRKISTFPSFILLYIVKNFWLFRYDSSDIFSIPIGITLYVTWNIIQNPVTCIFPTNEYVILLYTQIFLYFSKYII